jgi:hypothetical protein
MLEAMIPAPRRPLSLLLLSSLLAAACATAKPAQPPARPAPARATTGIAAPRPASGLYSADEALRDTLSSPWEYVGTGQWPGIARVFACVFRNQRVLVVNVYCTISDSPAFRLDVYSPTRGHVRIYAEANGPVSAFNRRDYFTFTAESEPLPGPETSVPRLHLAMNFRELSAYDEQRYSAYLPACFGGQELSKPKKSGCLGALSARAGEWSAQNRAFLDFANDDWYRVLREMRALSTRYGREPGGLD